MPELRARVETERASRYLTQFCKHAAAMGGGGHSPRMHLGEIMQRRQVQVSAEWSDTAGVVTFTPWGRCDLTAEADCLTVRIDAVDESGLAQIRDVINRDLERFSRRDPLTINWQEAEGSGVAPFRFAVAVIAVGRRRPSPAMVLLALAVIAVVGVHIGLFGTVAAGSPWTGIATNVTVALVALKLAMVLVRVSLRRRKAANGGPPDRTTA